jgi:four helix bundle protein
VLLLVPAATSNATATSTARPRRRLRDLDGDCGGALLFQKLDCYVVAKELAARVHRAEIAHSVLRDQARAAVSCFLQLAEGLPNDGAGMRRKYFTESNNSLHETVAAIDLAETLGVLGSQDAAPIQALAFRLKGMLRGQ